jgi:hypothetical protein
MPACDDCLVLVFANLHITPADILKEREGLYEPTNKRKISGRCQRPQADNKECQQ